MGDDDIPGSNPDMASPDIGGSVTIDSSGHLRSIDINVPGTADGSDPAHIDFGGGSHSDPAGPGWMPNFSDPNEPQYNPLPVRPGWHRDPVTGIDSPDLNLPASGDVPMSEPGDYPTPSSDEQLA